MLWLICLFICFSFEDMILFMRKLCSRYIGSKRFCYTQNFLMLDVVLLCEQFMHLLLTILVESIPNFLNHLMTTFVVLWHKRPFGQNYQYPLYFYYMHLCLRFHFGFCNSYFFMRLFFFRLLMISNRIPFCWSFYYI